MSEHKAIFAKMRAQMAPRQAALDDLHAKLAQPRPAPRRIPKPILKYTAAFILVVFISAACFANFAARKGVYIPVTKISKAKLNDMKMSKWGPFVIYNGKNYSYLGFMFNTDIETQKVYSGSYPSPFGIIYGDEATLKNMLDEYLGSTKGIREDELDKGNYGKEYDSSVTGEIYSLKGYDKDFRICLYNDSSSNSSHLTILESLDGTTLKNGKDLYGDKLHLKENYITLKYHPPKAPYNHNKTDFITSDELTSSDIESFIDALYESPTIHMKNFTRSQPNRKFVSLYFTMNDGMTVSMDLYEDGYILVYRRYEFYIHMDDEIYKKVFDALSN